MINRSGFAALFALVLLVVHPSPAEACGCAGAAPSSVAFKDATNVFIGTVIDVAGGMPQPILATFSVARTYRGAVAQRAVISGNGTNCDVAFTKGATYLVYAREDAGALLTHKCTRTRSLSAAAEDLRYLDNLTAGRPQVLVYGDVLRGIIQTDGSAARQALFEPLEVVAVNGRERRTVTTDQWGPYQIVLAPGEYQLWVERQGERVTATEKVSLPAGEERRLSFTAVYP